MHDAPSVKQALRSVMALPEESLVSPQLPHPDPRQYWRDVREQLFFFVCWVVLVLGDVDT